MTQSVVLPGVIPGSTLPLFSLTLYLFRSLSRSLRIRSVANAVAAAAAAVTESYQKANANVADNESEMNSSLCEWERAKERERVGGRWPWVKHISMWEEMQ